MEPVRIPSASSETNRNCLPNTAAEKNGVRWGIVEQDNTFNTAPLEAIRTSLENLKKLGAV